MAGLSDWSQVRKMCKISIRDVRFWPKVCLLQNSKRNLRQQKHATWPHLNIQTTHVLVVQNEMNTKAEIEEAKSRLRMQDITWVSNKGREGLGMRKGEYFSSSTGKSSDDSK